VFVLEGADRVEVVEEVVDAFDVAVHHGGGGLEALAVGAAVHAQPGFGAALLGLDALADLFGEDLGAAAGDRALAGVPQTVEHVLDREAGHLRHGPDLRGGEEVRRDLGKAGARLTDEGDVVVERQGGVVAALEQHRRGAF
jgi:hypothetical protein